jgi:hypothetical protein
MNEYTVNRETKVLMLSILKAGYCTEQEREQLANAFGLFVEQNSVISDDRMRELIDKL